MSQMKTHSKRELGVKSPKESVVLQLKRMWQKKGDSSSIAPEVQEEMGRRVNHGKEAKVVVLCTNACSTRNK